MLFRARTTLPDRPGALAALADTCGARDVNILGLQIFPGVGGVTDELVLRTPPGWDADEVADMVESAGGIGVSVASCSEQALVDGPISHLHALRRVAHDPSTLVEMLARLLGGDVNPRADAPEADRLDVLVGERQVSVWRVEPFTATEHARAIAFADVAAVLVDGDGEEPPGYDDLPRPLPGSAPEPVVRLAAFEDTAPLMRMHLRCSAESVYRRYAAPLTRVDERFARRLLMSGSGALVADAGGEVVGVVSVSAVDDSTVGVAEVALLVEDGWQRHGVGTRLLAAAARLARGHGAREVVMRSRGQNPALMALAFASGLRARVRLDGETVVVTVGVDSLKPLTTVPSQAGLVDRR